MFYLFYSNINFYLSVERRKNILYILQLYLFLFIRKIFYSCINFYLSVVLSKILSKKLICNLECDIMNKNIMKKINIFII